MTEASDIERKQARREQLRQAKAAQRERDRKARRARDHTASTQLTMTLSSGDKAILQAMVRMGVGESMSSILVDALKAHPRYREAMRNLPGLFGDS